MEETSMEVDLMVVTRKYFKFLKKIKFLRKIFSLDRHMVVKVLMAVEGKKHYTIFVSNY